MTVTAVTSVIGPYSIRRFAPRRATLAQIFVDRLVSGMTFIPFDATDDEIAARSVLREGVPASMRGPLIAWMLRCLANGSFVDAALVQDVENALDLSLGVGPTSGAILTDRSVLALLDRRDDRELLRMADYLLYCDYRPSGTALSLILDEGRSQYQVVERDGRRRLSLRLPEGVQAIAEEVSEVPGSAGRLLKTAWGRLYDFNADDSGAYSAAVKAVEAAALPALGITSPSATISHAVRAIEKKGASWRLPFKREHTEYPSRDVLLGMLKSLYRGQRDRHGSEAYSEVTHEEAETAVLMAVSLVGWFARDLVKERDVETFG